jgi:hypothetical protein
MSKMSRRENLWTEIASELTSRQKEILAQHTADLFDQLAGIEAAILSQRYDMKTGEVSQSYAAIAEGNNRSVSRVQQIVRKALRKLCSRKSQGMIKNILGIADDDSNTILLPGNGTGDISDKFGSLSIDYLELSARARSCLRNARISTIGELINKSEIELLKTKNFGQKSLKEIREQLALLHLKGETDLITQSAPVRVIYSRNTKLKVTFYLSRDFPRWCMVVQLDPDKSDNTLWACAIIYYKDSETESPDIGKEYFSANTQDKLQVMAEAWIHKNLFFGSYIKREGVL